MADKTGNIRKTKPSASADAPLAEKTAGRFANDDGAHPKNTPAAAEDTEKLRELAVFCSVGLEKLYPDARCSLDYGGDPWRLLVMARLSAQCTDERVNTVCRELFARFGTAAEMAEAPLSEIEEIVRPCGLFRMKASSVKAMSEKLVREYGGEIPRDIDVLLSFPGVGRKIANLVLGDVYGLGGIVADTHFMRICGRIGFYEEGLRDPVRVERVMDPLIPRDMQSDFCHRAVLFGRDICKARGCECGRCPLAGRCREGSKHEKDDRASVRDERE